MRGEEPQGEGKKRFYKLGNSQPGRENSQVVKRFGVKKVSSAG